LWHHASVFSRWKAPIVFVLCVVVACLLTYPLWCLGQIAVQDWGWSGLSKNGVQKYFNRSFLLCAVVAILVARPTFGTAAAGVVGPGFNRLAFLRGAALGTFAFAVLMLVGAGFSCVALRGGKALWAVAGKAVFSAVVVGFLEEWLFRRHLLNGACRRFGLVFGQVLVAALFASVHFLKPSAPPAGLEIDCWVGFKLLPLIFHQYSSLSAFVGGWLTLFMLGVLLSRLAVGAGSIGSAVGVHAAVIFWNKVLSSQFSVGHCEPLFAGSFQVGVVPLLTLSLMAVFVSSRRPNMGKPPESEGAV
jgi:membrane protease YdiL (CAAX protease family)